MTSHAHGLNDMDELSVGAEIRAALSKLRAAQKSSAGAPAYSRFINRPLGRVIAAVGSAFGATPNRLTTISAALTFSAIALIATMAPGAVAAVSTTALLALGYAFDAADGQLARLLGSNSAAGEWLDHFVDATKSSALHLAVAISWFRFYEVDIRLVLVPLAFTLVSAVFFFAMILSDQLRRAAVQGGGSPTKARPNSRLYAVAVVPADYGLLCILFLATAWPPLFIGLYSAVFLCQALILAASAIRWYRQMRTL